MWRAVIAALMLAYCLPAAYVTLWPDTVRDLASSLALARGEAFPLTGPGPINFGPYAGPAWIWLQAPPLLFVPTFVATSVYVAFVASLKFPALFVLGRRISGPRLGLCMAAAAAFPSAAIYQWIMFFHQNWTDMLVAWLLIVLLIADQRRSLAVVYAAIALLGLAVQIHTTTLFYLPLVGVVLYRIGIRGIRLAAHLLGALALIALWFTPVLFAPPVARGSVAGATERIASDMSRFSFEQLFTTLRTAYVDLPRAIGETYATAAHVPQWAWDLGLAVVGIAVIIGAVLRLQPGRAMRSAFIFALALLACAWTAAVASRAYTSFYLAYFLLPLSATVMGFSLEAAVSARSRWLRATGSTAIALLVISLFVAAYGARAVGRSALIDSRVLAMGDLAHPGDSGVRGTYVTAAARDALAREICAVPGPIVLHGELAHATSTSLRLDYVLHCPESADRIARFGWQPGTHLAFLPDPVAAALGITQGTSIKGLRLLRGVRPYAPGDARPFEKEFNYFERVADEERRPLRKSAIELDAAPHEVIAVYRHKPYATQWNGFKVTRDGTAVEPAHSTFDSWLYRADERGGHWRVEFETDVPQWVEVLAIPR
jgi:hypothetical protein